MAQTLQRPKSWEELRKEAKEIENQIDGKLVQLSKMGIALRSSSSATTSLAPYAGPADKVPLLQDEDGGEHDSNDRAMTTAFLKLSEEIGSALQRLTAVNDSMGEEISSSSSSSAPGGRSSGSAAQHTVQRHRDILLDYKQEFNRTRANVNAVLERHDLLDSVRRDIREHHRTAAAASTATGASGKNAGGNSSKDHRMELLLKENEHARNSERLIDDHISVAVEAREALVNQRMVFKAVQSKLNDLSTKFPMVNNVVNKINFRRRRDAIILGAVIGICLLFFIWYQFGG